MKTQTKKKIHHFLNWNTRQASIWGHLYSCCIMLMMLSVKLKKNKRSTDYNIRVKFGSFKRKVKSLQNTEVISGNIIETARWILTVMWKIKWKTFLCERSIWNQCFPGLHCPRKWLSGNFKRTCVKLLLFNVELMVQSIEIC